MTARPTVVLACIWVRRRLGAYADGALDDRRARVTSTHLAACARCRLEVESVRRLHLDLRTALVSTAAPDWTGFWPGVVRGIEAGQAPVVAPRLDRRWVARHITAPRLAVGGALTTAVAVGVTLWRLLLAPGGDDAAVTVQSAGTEHPTATVMVYSPPEHDLAVVWVFDLD